MFAKLFFVLFISFFVSAASVTHAQIVINEIFPNPDGDNSEWIELYNPTENNLVLDHWSIKDAAQPAKSLDGKTINALSYLVIEESGEGWLNNDEETISLLASDSATIDTVSYRSGTHPYPKENQSLSRYPDGSSGWVITLTATRGAPNAAPPTPTPNPTDRPPDPTKTPTPQSTVTQTPPTKTTTPKLSPTRKPSPTPIEDTNEDLSLPTRTPPTTSPQVLGEFTNEPPPKRSFLPIFFIGLGTVLLVSSCIWMFRDMRKRSQEAL